MNQLLALGLVLLLPLTTSARNFGSIQVEGPLRSELNKVLKATVELHSACIEQNDQRIKSSLSAVISSIDKAGRQASLAEDDRMLLLKMLDSARAQLQATRMNQGDLKIEALKESFNQLVQIAQVFKLDSYRIFFCPKDQSVWIQESLKAKNPVNPDKYADCGNRVR